MMGGWNGNRFGAGEVLSAQVEFSILRSAGFRSQSDLHSFVWKQDR
jgi:hypothetical protein